MRTILNITNGDCAVEIMKKAGIAGQFLPWRDVLHDGPVPESLSLDELSNVRAQFIAGRNWGDLKDIQKSFRERDRELKTCGNYDKVLLWFEHDLYDQLQILQLLDWFHSNPAEGVDVSIICTDNYLGMLSPDEMKTFEKHEAPLTEKHYLLTSKAWSAFRSNTPEKWYQLLSDDTSALPFLEGAIIRLLEEYPNSSNGLSRTARQALEIIAEGETCPGKIFARNQELEERVFLGDSSFWIILQELLDSTPPLLKRSQEKAAAPAEFKDQAPTITPIGRDVLSGKRNGLDIANLDRWIGGVHLENTNAWCWNSDSRSIAKRAAQK